MTLLDDAIRGDRNAREQLVREHGRLVFALCRRLDPQPEDAYQEIWEKVFRGLARFDTRMGPPLRAWITTVARRHLIDRHRRRSGRGEVVQLTEAPGEPADAEQRLEQEGRLARLESALDLLPVDQRTVIVHHHLHGCDLATLADDTGVPVGTLKSRLHRGRARLAALLRRNP